VIDVLQEEIDGREPLRQPLFEDAPLRRRNDARQQVVRKDSLGALLVAVNGERDALREECLFGFRLVLAQLRQAGFEQAVDERAALRTHRPRAIEHFVVRAAEAVGRKQRVQRIAGRTWGRGRRSRPLKRRRNDGRHGYASNRARAEPRGRSATAPETTIFTLNPRNSYADWRSARRHPFYTFVALSEYSDTNVGTDPSESLRNTRSRGSVLAHECLPLNRRRHVRDGIGRSQ
jgi:hypothetical protein